MTICDLCSGSHVTSACVIGRAHVHACLTTRSCDDYRPVRRAVVRAPKGMRAAGNVIPLFTDKRNRASRPFEARSIDREVAAG
jgi:hypothetical protein